jgi:hypothetical protein
MCGGAGTRLWSVSRESAGAGSVLTSRREYRESIRRARSVPLYTRLAPLNGEFAKSSMPILGQQSHQSDPSRRVIVPEGCRYSRSCKLYRLRESKRSVTMRQAHVGGDKLFGDYAGDTAPVIVG